MEYVEVYKAFDEIKNEVLAIKNVVDVSIIDSDSTMLIALVTKPIFSTTERHELVDNVKDVVYKYSTVKEVLVTFDADLFYKVKDASENQNKIDKVIGVAKSRVR